MVGEGTQEIFFSVLSETLLECCQGLLRLSRLKVGELGRSLRVGAGDAFFKACSCVELGVCVFVEDFGPTVEFDILNEIKPI